MDAKALAVGLCMALNEGERLTDMEALTVEAELATVGYCLGRHPRLSVLKSLGDIMSALIEVRGWKDSLLGTTNWVPLFNGDEEVYQSRIDIMRGYIADLMVEYQYVPRTLLTQMVALLWQDDDTFTVRELYDLAEREVQRDGYNWGPVRRLRLVDERGWRKEMAKLTADAHWVEVQGNG